MGAQPETQEPMESARAGRPRLRRITTEVLTGAGWITGTLVLPQVQSLTDHLETAGPFLKLTDADVPGASGPVEFIAVQRSAVSLVAPIAVADPVETSGSGGFTSPWRISCLFEEGLLEGRLDFLVNLRLSDYLKQQSGFLVVRDGVWHPAVPSRAPRVASGPWPVALVNISRVLGVAEGENPSGAGHPGRLPASEWAE